jgi:hypothetical protein
MKRKVTILTEANESGLFRAPQFPSSLLHVEADLKSKKPCTPGILLLDRCPDVQVITLTLLRLAYSLL